MCQNIVEKGNVSLPLFLYNRSTVQATNLETQLSPSQVTVASSIHSAISRTDIIFICLSDDVAVLEVVKEAVKTDVKGKLFVDCSTVHPDTTAVITELLSVPGAEFVACPVFGVPAVAVKGDLICVLAGPKSSVDKVKPFTVGVMGRAIIDFSGAEQRKATHLKIVGNTFLFNVVENLSEGYVLAEKSGLGVENLHKFLEQMYPGLYTTFSGRLRTGDYYKHEAVSQSVFVLAILSHKYYSLWSPSI
jgi:3-hydroxyisobutyrate dehydrogenase-like beta-hydroxyacid dehydrogenase